MEKLKATGPVAKVHTTCPTRPCLNKKIYEKGNKKNVEDVFIRRCTEVQYNDSDIEVDAYPFPHCCIKNFITTADLKITENNVYLDSLKSELLSLNFSQKSNDLYKFAQSNELVDNKSDENLTKVILSSRQVELHKFTSLLQIEFLSWLKETTKVKLEDDINMFCAQYKYTDTLLCHDDELERRRFAYIYYLTDDWQESDGGYLDLFGVNKNMEPNKVVKSILPVNNSLVFFEVSQVSFHQVREVLSLDKTRLSLSGWFHGPELPRNKCGIDYATPMYSFIPTNGSDSLSNWIAPQYLSIGTQGNIQDQFEETSEIQLKDFLIIEKFNELSSAFQNIFGSDNWEIMGPANRRKYRILKESIISNEGNTHQCKALLLIKSFVNILRSEEFFLYLSNITGLSLHPMAADVSDSDQSENEDEVPTKKHKAEELAPGVNAKCRYEVRKWSPGDYTLIQDNDNERGEYALDVNLHFCADDWEQNFGGYISYLAEGEDAELLTVVPSKNCLSIAYRDQDAIRFVKHINCRAKSSFFDISFVYKE